MRLRTVYHFVVAASIGTALVPLRPAVCAAQDAAASPSGGDGDAKPAQSNRFERWAAFKADDEGHGSLTDQLGRRHYGVRTEAFVFPVVAQPGEPLTVVVSTRNVGSVPVYAYLTLFESDPCEIFIHDDAGRLAPLTPLGRKEWVEWLLRSGNDLPNEVCIRPGCAVAEKLRAEMYYDLSRPGKYTVFAGRPTTFEIARAPLPKGPNVETEKLDVTTASFDEQPSFERKWQTASSVAGRAHKDLQLTCLVAADDRRGSTNLVVSLTNVCRSGAVAHSDGRSYSNSYSPEDGIELAVGTRAADYQILLRDAAGNPLALSAAGQAWLRESELKWDRALRPGEAVGFAIPLEELFPLQPAQEYTAVVVLRGKRRDDPPWVGGPVTIRVPAVEIPGVTRPRYGSNEFWARLASSATARSAKLTLEGRIGNVDGYATLGLDLVNRSGHPIPAQIKKGDDTILIRDSREDPVIPNKRAKDDYLADWSSKHWSSKRGEETDVLYPRGDAVGDDTGASGGYGLSAMYPLRAGSDYTVLAAVSLREANALVAAAPVVFRAPIPYRHEPETPETRPLKPTPAPTVPEAQDERWQEYERFAGKTFEGLALQAHATASLQLDIELHNSSKEPILVKKWKGDSDYELLVRDASGRSASMTEKGKKFFGGGALLEIRDLKPGEAITASLPLTELFEMQTPGEYTVLASLPVIGDVDAVLTAAPIKVRVEAKPTPKN
jgi:hypothetical protein